MLGIDGASIYAAAEVASNFYKLAHFLTLLKYE